MIKILTYEGNFVYISASSIYKLSLSKAKFTEVTYHKGGVVLTKTPIDEIAKLIDEKLQSIHQQVGP